MSSYVICSIIQSLNFVIANSSDCLIRAAPTTQKPKIICIDELDKMPRQFQEKLLSFMETGHIKVDQMHKHYDFKIKGAKVFGACNEIALLIEVHVIGMREACTALQRRRRNLSHPITSAETY
jgi:hypothetical protein